MSRDGKITFSLNRDQVPDPHKCIESWADALRWLVVVMDYDDKRLPFVASCFKYCLDNGALTAKQSTVCNTILREVISDYSAGVLYCQNIDAEYDWPTDVNTGRMN